MRREIRSVIAKDGSRALVVQHGRNLFSLIIKSRQTGHGRWGNAKEIKSDEDFFVETGRLPVSKGAGP
jgi:hypothetical protein